MSSKQEPAQAPATVSQAADPGTAPPPQPPPPPTQQQPPAPPPQVQHPPNYHQGAVIYQQPYVPVQAQHYQPQGGPVWNQPPQAAVHYVQYAPQHETGVYQDGKVQGYNHYGTVHFTQPMDNGDMMMRGQTSYVPQQYITSPQWYSTAQAPPAQFVPSYATNFSIANDPAYNPNHPMNQHGAGRRDDFQGAGDTSSVGYMQFVPFVAPIGVMESQAHASASYTANWVSSTSSIPPEMKDEPESDNISQYDSHRPSSQLNGDSWTDREDHYSPSNVQPPSQPGGRPANSSEKEKSQKSSKTSKSERGEEKRELTFDERLEKARMQKSRVENEGANGATSPNSGSVAQSSNAVNPPVAPCNPPRANGQRKEFTSQPLGYNNNNNAHHASGRGRGNNHHYQQNNGNYGQHHGPVAAMVVGDHQQYHQMPRANIGNSFGERDRQPRRDNSYGNNRYENNHQNLHQNQQHSREMNSEFYRQPNHRGGGRGGRGGYRGGYQQHQNPPQPPQQYMVPPQMMNPQMMTTMNAFKNTHIGNYPPVPRIPLLPDPFGLSRQQVQQDVKFHNTWLDATSCPLPLAAVMSMDTRFGRGGAMMGGPSVTYRGRGRGYGPRGGYRGGGYVNNARYGQRAAEQPTTSSKPTEEVEVKENEKEPAEKSPSDKDEQSQEKVEEKVEEKQAEEQQDDEKVKEESKEDDKTKVDTDEQLTPEKIPISTLQPEQEPVKEQCQEEQLAEQQTEQKEDEQKEVQQEEQKEAPSKLESSQCTKDSS